MGECQSFTTHIDKPPQNFTLSDREQKSKLTSENQWQGM